MKAFLPVLGISDSTVEAVERSTKKLYDILNAHFLEYPYLIGGRPSVADFGLMAPMVISGMVYSMGKILK